MTISDKNEELLKSILESFDRIAYIDSNELPEIVSMRIGAGAFVGIILFVVNAVLIAAVRKKIKNNA